MKSPALRQGTLQEVVMFSGGSLGRICKRARVGMSVRTLSGLWHQARIGCPAYRRASRHVRLALEDLGMVRTAAARAFHKCRGVVVAHQGRFTEERPQDDHP